MKPYTDWTSGEPIEKEWAMTGPTDPALRARLLAWGRSGLGRTTAAWEAELDAALAAAEAAPPYYEVWDTESANLLSDGSLAEVTQHVYQMGQANPDAASDGLVIVPGRRAAEAAPLDVEHDDVPYPDQCQTCNDAHYAALRSPDTETAGDGL